MIKKKQENEIEEANTIASGNVVGYQAPLGTDTTPLHKSFWNKDKNKKVKTSSPELQKDIHKFLESLNEEQLEEQKQTYSFVLKSLKKFDKLPLEQKHQAVSTFAEENLEYVASGQDRMVYKFGNYVLKVAYKTYTRKQNQEEVKTYPCLTNRYCTEIFAYDSDFCWLISELAEVNSFKTVNFFDDLALDTVGGKNMKGFKNGLSVFIYAVLGAMKSSGGSGSEVSADTSISSIGASGAMSEEDLGVAYSENVSWFSDFVNKIKQCGVSPLDFSPSNWGFRSGVEVPILVDYGTNIDPESASLLEENKLLKIYNLIFENKDIKEVINEPKRAVSKSPEEIGIVPNGGYENILKVVNEATPAEKEYWTKWYIHANHDVKELAQKHNITIPAAAGVVAILSPGNKWKNNLLAADRVLEYYNQTKDNPDSAMVPLPKIAAYPVSITKALSLLKTGKTEFIKGPKVTIFFQSLLDPSLVENKLVLDGHAINIWRGSKENLKGLKMPTKEERAVMVDDYQKAAKASGITVQGVQALTWYIWKYLTTKPKVKQTQIKIEKVKPQK